MEAQKACVACWRSIWWVTKPGITSVSLNPEAIFLISDSPRLIYSQQGKDILYGLTYLWNINFFFNKANKTHREQISGCQRQGIIGGENEQRWSNGFVFVVQLLSHVWCFVTPWTVACQAPLSMECPREEYWSG